MERIILMVIRSFFQLPFWLFKIFRYANTEKYDEATGYALLHRLTCLANRRGRVKIKCYGLENLPKETGYVMYANHQGMFDALILLETHERPFATVSKKEVKDIFFLKQIFRILRSKFIDREDVRQSMKVMMEVTKEVKEGRNYLIFPEGTRSKSSNRIKEFKSGSFKCAMNAKCPIVPVAIIDSYKAFDTHSIAKLTVQIHYLQPLYYKDYQSMKSVEIAAYVAGQIKDVIEKYEGMYT
ncbi:MAG: 1-acyl-sn-glycerol-3-phosphate acyltransferase [Lachnoclostridium sp.]|jgi:1-acyl-sn-glycerol-3-phosphate acyltransferase